MGASGYRRTNPAASSGLPLGGATRTNGVNRSSFNAGSTYTKDKQGTTLAHAARNGVIGGGT